ncbi:MAG: hypothetical protein V4541_10505 [Bacteroidota bacterium]
MNRGKKENIVFLFIAFMFFGIGFSVAKFKYSKERYLTRLPELKTGNSLNDIYTEGDSIYKVKVTVDTAILRKEYSYE